MTDIASEKLLFVLSNDFGELLNSMYFLAGRRFTTTIMMPANLFSRNRDNLQPTAWKYESPTDIIQAVHRETPDIVFLFSGYLYGVNNIFGVEMLDQLVGELKKRRCHVVTSDPFLGLLTNLDETTFNNKHPAKKWLTEHFSRVAEVVRDVTHLYVTNPKGFATRKSLSFFNERIIADVSELSEIRNRLKNGTEIDASKREWLFILSSEDYGAQVNRLGRERFESSLIEKLRETSAWGRQPVLLAPQPLVTSISTARPRIERLVSIPFCQYNLFMDLLLDAEYVFYWNLFSSSIPIRLLNSMPFFFFDFGHMARAVPPLFQLGIREYYRSSSLAYLDQTQPLKCSELATRANEDEQQGMAASREYFRHSPSPDEVVHTILEGKR